jgi:hypothetical protein
MDYIRPRSGYQPCDTFFIEDDYRMQAEKQAKQEHDKLVARERQYAMANQLSRITCAEFRDDVLQQMLEMDVSCFDFDCCVCMAFLLTYRAFL